MEILRMRGNIQELVNECKRAFVASGDDFDYNAQFRAMERIRQKNIAEINRLNDIVAEEEDFTRRTQSPAALPTRRQATSANISRSPS